MLHTPYTAEKQLLTRNKGKLVPAFNYRCSLCNHSETRFNIRIERADKQKCERCHRSMARMVSEANFRPKGDGWTPKHYGDK